MNQRYRYDIKITFISGSKEEAIQLRGRPNIIVRLALDGNDMLENYELNSLYVHVMKMGLIPGKHRIDITCDGWCEIKSLIIDCKKTGNHYNIGLPKFIGNGIIDHDDLIVIDGSTWIEFMIWDLNE